MDAQRWNRIQELFHEALALPESSRAAFLETACGADTGLREDVLAMLAEDGRPSVLARDAVEVAGELLPDAPPIATIGPYRLLSAIGRGGMGVVYLAERDDLGSRAAIKVLPNAWISAVRRERFALEQRALSRLVHPSIARLYDAGILEDGTPWFAMEWVDGEPVTAYCARRQPTVKSRLGLFRSICEAVQYAHQQAILHRDLKPSNIFVKADGSVRLLDFGIAKRLDLDDDTPDLTRTGVAVMTPAYAAPELIRGEPATVQADVYSLGVILYELLAQAPFVASTRRTADAAALMEPREARPPSGSPTRIEGPGRAAWADLDVLCLTAMHEDLGRRYRSVEALSRDVDRFLRDEPLEARPDEFRYKLRKFTARNRAPLLAAAAVAAALTALIAFFTFRLAVARDAAVAEAARAQRIQQFMLHLFEGGDKEAGPADKLEVLTLVDRSARDARLLAADPAAQADLFQTLGEIYHSLGKYPQASEMLDAALEKRRGLPNKAPALVAESVQAVGLLRLDQGKLDEAESLVRQALALAGSTLPKGHPGIDAATAALGRVLTDRGQYKQAIEVLEEAARLQAARAAPEQDTATVLIRLADAHFYEGDYDRAEALSTQVYDMYRRMYGEDHPRVADPVINLGTIASQRGQYALSEKWFRKAAEINRDYYGPDHPETASSLRGLGQALASQKRFDEAEPVLRQVLAVRERVYGPVHSGVANAVNSLAHVAQGKGDLVLAEQLFQRAADIYRKANGDEHHFVGVALANLAGVYLDKKDYARAERTLRGVVVRFQRVLPEDHFDLAVARVKLGRALLGLGRREEAARESSLALAALAKTAPESSWVRSAREDLVAARR
ncbi:MAG: serine/threonine-protein kinase [Bryobacteraceae bacterium]